MLDPCWHWGMWFVLAVAGFGGPCWSLSLCVVLVSGEEQAQGPPSRQGAWLQHMKSFLCGWAPRLCPREPLGGTSFPDPLALLADCYLGESRPPPMSSEMLTHWLSLGSCPPVCGEAPLSRAGPRQQKVLLFPPWGLGGCGTCKAREQRD